MHELDELAATEVRLQRIVDSVRGTMEEKAAQLRDRGVYRGYARVFAGYLAAFEASPEDLEPLKRATFLAWYALAEPPCFSGVGDLPEEARTSIVGLVERRASDVDREFWWMLAWYLRISPYALPDLGELSGLRAALESTDPEGWQADSAAVGWMRGRGLMGEYWISMSGGTP